MRIGTQGQVANGFTFLQWAIFYIIKNVDVSFDKLSVCLCLRRVAEVNILGIAEVLSRTLQSFKDIGMKLAYIKTLRVSELSASMS